MKITWLGHGTFQFELASGQVILMDPWTDGNPSYPKGYEIHRVDTMCITHGHQDHIHDAVPLGLKFKPEIAAIYETCLWLNSKGVENTQPMNKGGSQKLGDITVTMVTPSIAAGFRRATRSSMGARRRGTCCGCPMAARCISRATPTSSPTCS